MAICKKFLILLSAFLLTAHSFDPSCLDNVKVTQHDFFNQTLYLAFSHNCGFEL